MSHSLSKVLLHVVFATKDRIHMIPECRLNGLHGYISSVIINLNGQAYKVGGISNHIHIAMNLPRNITLGRIMERIKVSSSKWMKEGEEKVHNFKWQPGYGVFSLGESQLPNLIKYIENQKIHHMNKTYENEMEEIRIRYNIPKKDINHL